MTLYSLAPSVSNYIVLYSSMNALRASILLYRYGPFYIANWFFLMGMGFFAEVQNQMGQRVELCDRDHVSNPASIRSNCASKQVHACSWVNMTGHCLLRNNVEAMDTG